MIDVRLTRRRESVIEQLAMGFARDELSPRTLEVRVQAALGARSVRELRELTSDLPSAGDLFVALLWGTVDGVEVAGHGRWLATEAVHASWLLGRASACDVRLDAEGVSRRHAVLIKRGRCWSIVDLHATNGTIVNGSRIDRRRLRPGDQIALGYARLAVTGDRPPR